jgi:uncharacterized protein YecT (DUF1311 family)
LLVTPGQHPRDVGRGYAAIENRFLLNGLEELMKKITTTVACLILVALPYAAARAQTEHGTTATNEKSFEQADGALNAAFQRLLEKISPAGQSALREAESTWIHFRDQECDFEALGSVGGSVHSLSILICRERITRTRTQELLAQVNCPEGDVTCGHQ